MAAKIIEKYICEGERGSYTVYYKTDKNQFYYYSSYIDRRGIRQFGAKTKINSNTYEIFKSCGKIAKEI